MRGRRGTIRRRNRDRLRPAPPARRLPRNQEARNNSPGRVRCRLLWWERSTSQMTRTFIVSFLTMVAVAAHGAEPTPANIKKAVFAGGCFWCIQTPYDNPRGVVETIVGHTRGRARGAHYEKGFSQQTQHTEGRVRAFVPAHRSLEQKSATPRRR